MRSIPPPDDLTPIPSFPIETNAVGVRFRDIGEQRALVLPTNPFCSPSAGTVCPAFVLRQHPELHLFERNPRDVYYDLLSDAFDDPWPSNLAAPRCLDPTCTSGVEAPQYELPADVVIPYGANFITDVWPNYVSVATFGDQDFLRAQDGAPTLLSQWEEPSGGSPSKPLRRLSVAAARVLVLPECSAALDIQGTFFSQFKDYLANALHCSTFAGIEFDPVVQIAAATYLTHVDPNDTTWQAIDSDRTAPIYPWDGVAGGVMVNGNASFTAAGGAVDCLVEFTYDFRYGIDQDGVLEVDSIPVRLNAIGSGGFGIPCGTLESKIQDAFENAVPSVVHDFAAGAQVIPPSTPESPLTDPKFECAYPMINGEDVGDSDECAPAINQFRLGANTEAGALGLDATSIVSAVQDPANWTCRPPTWFEIAHDCAATPTALRGRCQFHLKASGVLAEPNEVRVVWPPLDELTNPLVTEVSPSSAAFILALQQGKDAFEALCTPPHDVTAAQPYYQRYFAAFHATQSCTPEPQPAPPPVCPCTDDSQCLTGQACANEGSTSQCFRLCTSNSDCRFYGVSQCVGDQCY